METKQDVELFEMKVAVLDEKVTTLDMQLEAVLAYQKKAHAEIMEKLVESNELNGQEVKQLEKRAERIEKHLDLPSLVEHDA